MAIQRSREANVGSDEKKMKGLKPSDLLIPGASILILLLLTIFVYIPSITDASKMRDEIKEVRADKQILQRNIDLMTPIFQDQAQLQSDLKKTKRIIPTKLEVGDFSYYVDRLARKSGLKFEKISNQNTSKSTDEDIMTKNDNVESYVSGVTGSIVYKGDYEEIVEFLDLLQRESPYIIEARKLEMDSSRLSEEKEVLDEEDDSKWELELNLMGYYIETESKPSIAQMYSPIVPYTNYPEYLDVFERKAEILDTEEEPVDGADTDQDPDRDEDVEPSE